MKPFLILKILFLISLPLSSSAAQSSRPVHHFSAPYLFEIYHNGQLSDYRTSMTFSAYRDVEKQIEFVECKYVLITIDDSSKTIEANAYAFSTTDGTINNVAIDDSVVSFTIYDDFFSPECGTQFVCDKRKDKIHYDIHGIGICSNKLGEGSTTTEWKQVESIHLPYNELVR